MKDRIKEVLCAHFDGFTCHEIDSYSNGTKKQGFVFEVEGTKESVEKAVSGISKATGTSVKVQQLNSEG